MILFFYFFIFILGLCVGSFLNALIYRLEKKETLLTRSHCPACQHLLDAKDLIPVLSFFWLKGKCRYCQQAISWQYPLVELVTAFFFIFISYQWLSGHLLFAFAFYYLFIFSALIVIFVFDLKYYLIPDKIIYPAIGLSLFFNFWLVVGGYWNWKSFFTCFFSAVAAAGFFLLLILISRGKWMGGGDVKLVFLMGLFLGPFRLLAALFLAFLSGAFIGLWLIFLKRKNMKSEVPFGPFLVTATFFMFFWGEKLIDWYLGFLGMV